MSSVIVVLKNGTKIEVEGGDSADWASEPTFPGASTGIGARTIRLIVKRADATIGRFDADEIAGYAVDYR